MNKYCIPNQTQPIIVNAQWDKKPWNEIPALQIDQYSGQKPDHFPGVQAKLAYDSAALYVIFRVEDRFVRALWTNYQDKVFEDSCVEFFFTPGEETRQGYFNLEVNCGGTALFHHQKGRGNEDLPISAVDFDLVDIAHSLPKTVDPEIQEEITWVVEYRLPFEILSNYAPIKIPSSGRRWQANLYKCADASSNPHWLTWSPIQTPSPDFHTPEFFGKLIFE